ncbi:MAG: hypothetical protein CR994_07560 [Maribacter sp.]|nr:MAG: hypothetical protein CR994_07560 [Maribacter sp.]
MGYRQHMYSTIETTPFIGMGRSYHLSIILMPYIKTEIRITIEIYHCIATHFIRGRVINIETFTSSVAKPKNTLSLYRETQVAEFALILVPYADDRQEKEP